MKRILFVLIAFILTTSGYSQTFRLGVITDFEQSAEIDSILQIVVYEINRTAGPSKTFDLNAEENFSYGIKSFQEAQSAYQSLAEDVDYVLLLGINSVKGCADLNSFPVPTIGLGVIDPYLQDLPYENGKSGVENFTYIWAAKDLQQELSVFQQIVPFDNLTILVNESAESTYNKEKGQEYMDGLEKSMKAKFQILEIGEDIEKSLSAIDPESDAVYVSYFYGLNASEVTLISETLKEKKLPSFSSQKFHVDNGIMSCISDKNDFQQVVRKLAVMVDESLQDEPLSEMQVNINFKEDLFINARTAKEIGLALSFEVLFTANLIDEKMDLPVYSLEQVMELAFENNFGIKISNQDISLAIQDAKLAKSAILPYLDLGINGRQINEESTFVLLDQPERRLAGQLSLDQIIYSEEAFAGMKIAYYLKMAQEFATEAEILQIYFEIFQDYFTVLAAKTSVQIETENLENLKTNLEMARIRVNSGAASRTEILRWESEVSTAKQNLVEANTALYNAKFQLNNSLANTLENDFDIADITVEDQLYLWFTENLITQSIQNPKDLELVANFLVDESVKNNPNKEALLQQINAMERRNLQNKRLLYTPNVALQAQTTQVLARGGANSDVSDLDLPDNTWSIGVGLSFPIFTGNQRRVNLQSSKIQLDQLNNSRMQLDQQLELAVKTSLINTVATTTNIEFSRIASNNAEANFELVRDQYQLGEVTITQLIDAQQSALGAKLRYAVAVYDYLQSQMQLEYSVGFFSMFASDEELQAFNQRFLEFRMK